jgi:hypothetical protein
MSRTVDANISTWEDAGDLNPTETLIVRREVLSFAAFTSQANATLETDVPQTFAVRNGGTYAYVAYRKTDGTSRLQVITLATAANWALSGGAQVSANTVLVMRNGVFTDASNATWLYTAVASGSQVQLRRQQINAITADPPTISLSNYGPVFGPQLTNTSTLVRRVEAICPTDGGIAVAIGTHDFANDLSTIQFWYLPDASTALQLDTLIQADLSETYSTWYAAATWATYISAIYDSTAKAVRVIANGHPSGKSMQFSITAGVETPLEAVAPVDPVYGATAFRASGVSKINGLFYLCGRLTQVLSDGTLSTYDCYLTSGDGRLWSVGERSSFLSRYDSAGTLCIDVAANPVKIYYGGNLIVYVADATPVQGYNTSTQQLTLTSKLIPNYSNDFVTGGPHRFTLQLRNEDGALTDHVLLTGIGVMYLSAGQWGTNSLIGAYGIDKPDTGNTNESRDVIKISARDVASCAITGHNVPLAVDWWGQDAWSSDLADDDGLVIKTRTADILTLDAATATKADLSEHDATLGSSGLQYKGLNNPLISYIDMVDTPDVLMKATLLFPDTGSTYALPTFAFLFNADDAGFFNGLAIPKVNAWGSKTKPRIVKSNLKAYDEARDSGGFNFESRYQGLWASNNYDSGDAEKKYLQALLELPSHYNTETAYTHPAGATRDYAFRVSGRRVQLYWKAHDYAAATCAANAGYTLICEYLFGDDARLYPAGRTRPAFGVSVDALALKQAYAQAAYAAKELTLTSAASYENASHYTTSGIPPGVDHFGGANAENTAMVAVDAGGFDLNIDLRNYFYPGQVIYIDAGVGFATIGYLDNHGGSIYNWVHFTQAYHATTGSYHFYLRAGTYWAQASSATASKTISGATIWTDPGAKKTYMPLIGWGAFVGNDPASLVYDDGWVRSDGVTHYRLDKGWDPTNPIALPNDWKLELYQNVLGLWRISTAYGIDPAMVHIMIEKELARIAETSYYPFGDTLGDGTNLKTRTAQWVTYIPTYYAYPNAQGSPSQTVYNRVVGGEDDFADIPNAAGLLFEVSARSGTEEADVPQVYVTGNGASAGRGYVTIDTLPAGPILASDFVTLSGRGALKTTKATHPSTAVVAVAPIPITATAAPASYVTLSRLGCFAGARRTLEDGLKRLCALAGVRVTHFRNLMTGAYAKTPYPLTITTTVQTLPLVTSLADFVLELNAHLDASAWLRIDFRTKTGSAAYYRLALRQATTGCITAGLQTISTDITADGSGLRWFEYTPPVRISGQNLNAAAADTVALRISVVGGKVSVDANGQHVWDFDPESYVHTDGTSYDVRGAYSVGLSYSATVSGNSATVRVPELWDAMPEVAMNAGANTSAKILKLCSDYQVTSKATSDGGLEFTRFIVRDTGRTLRKAIRTHTHSRDDSQPVGYVLATGNNVTGAYINTDYIAEQGFRAAVIDNTAWETTQQASAAAQLESRKSIESAREETVAFGARMSDEVEDLVPLTYAPGGDAPAQAEINVVITELHWTRAENVRNATAKVRRYVAWQ